MKTKLMRIGGSCYVVFPYQGDAEKWQFLLGTVLRRKRISFINYQNGFKIF